MKKLLVCLTVIGLLLSVAVVTSAAAPSSVRLTWSGSVTTTQTFNWTTDTATTVGKIQYKKSSSSSYTTVTAAAGVVYGDVKLWKHTLTGLSSGTTYNYRIGDGSNWSAYSTFKTASSTASEFSFLLFGDTSNEDLEYEKWQETITAAYAANPSAKFWMNVGDIVEIGTDYANWVPWLSAAQPVLAKLQGMPTCGGDECKTVEDTTGRPVLYTKLWNLPQNGPTGYKGESYSFDYGYAHIVSIENELGSEFAGDPAAEQAAYDALTAWLAADLAATTKPWKIVVMHIPFYGNLTDRNGGKQRNALLSIIDQYNVDLVINGHDHVIARTFPMNGNQMLESPADGTVYYMPGHANDGAKKTACPKIWNAFSYDPQDTGVYAVITLDNDDLEIKSFKADGTEIDEYEIDKSTPSDSTVTIPPGEFDKTRAVCFGTLVSWGNRPEEDESIPGKWYVDVKVLATLIDGVFDPATLQLCYDDEEIVLQCTPEMFLDPSEPVMISLEGLQSLGFEAYYNETNNLVFVERYRGD